MKGMGKWQMNRALSGKYRRCARWISVVMIVLTLLLIYNFSSEDGAVSSARSAQVARCVARIVVPGYAQMSVRERVQAEEALHTPIRKAAHMAEFAFAGCWLCVFARTLGIRGLRGAMWAFVGSLIFAALDETHQLFVGGRGPSIRDVGIDCLGAMVGIAVAAALLPRIARRASKT